MSKIKLIYIDKDKWQQENDMLLIKEDIDYELSYEIIHMDNVINLDTDITKTTLCTKDRLISTLESKLKSNVCKHVVIKNFKLSLDDIFNDILSLINQKEVNVFILEKSEFPIRNNVTMTIDTVKYDIDTDYNKIKELLNTNLSNSLNNAKKSNNPVTVSDVGVSLKQEDNSSILDMMLAEFGLTEEYDLEDDDEIFIAAIPSMSTPKTAIKKSIGINKTDTGMVITNGMQEVEFSIEEAKTIIKLMEVFTNA